jgi:hypothetical protein
LEGKVSLVGLPVMFMDALGLFLFFLQFKLSLVLVMLFVV